MGIPENVIGRPFFLGTPQDDGCSFMVPLQERIKTGGNYPECRDKAVHWNDPWHQISGHVPACTLEGCASRPHTPLGLDKSQG